ncbi:MAG: hypothetical protein ACI9F9_002839 [Candidatus Paceibacteria bacterium]|jgi:hypothetical protein
MQRENLDLTQEDGYRALRGHIQDKAQLARERHGSDLARGDLSGLLEDRDIVRHPTALVWDSSQLRSGEFGIAKKVEVDGARSYVLILHEHFTGRGEELAMVAAYHIPTINYVDLVTHEEAELFGATLFGLEVDEYYARVCQLADELARLT